MKLNPCDRLSAQPSPSASRSDILAPAIDVRESMKRDLPNCLQPVLTLITAKPYAGQPPSHRTAFDHLLTASLALGTGISLSYLGILQGDAGLALIPLGWGLTVHGSRKLRLTIQHACAHNAVFGNPHLNRILGEMISIITLSPGFRQYQHNHTRVHHSNRLLQPGDATHDYLIHTIGFQPEMPVNQLWHHLFKTLISPKFHLRVLSKRCQACFLTADITHNILAIANWLTTLAGVAHTHSWLAFVISWGIPITLFFQMSMLLRKCVEHRWTTPNLIHQNPRLALGRMTAAIFLGERTPDLTASDSFLQRLVSWSRWTLRMLFYHLPCRILVLTGDSPCHDYHHRHPSSKDWCNAIFARQQDLDAGCPGWPEPYLETWGLLEAIAETLKSLNQQPAIDPVEPTE